MLICVKLYQNKLVDSASTEFTANVTQKYKDPSKLIYVIMSGSVSRKKNILKYIKERKKTQFPRPFIENRQAQKGADTSIQLFYIPL